MVVDSGAGAGESASMRVPYLALLLWMTAFARRHAFADQSEQRALTLMEKNGESKLQIYSLTEISYAQVLQHAGRKEEAARLNSSGKMALDALRRTRCDSCTVSAEGLTQQTRNEVTSYSQRFL